MLRRSEPVRIDDESGRRPVHDLDPRRRRLWELQDFSQGRGLEIGPLHEAIVRKDQADVRYVDILDRAGLLDHYRDHPRVPVADIPDIDFPLTRPDGRIVSLSEASRAGAPYDWVVASHVVEHVPDLIGWLGQLAEVCADGGALVLVVPDRRFCFDVHRPPTTVGAMLEAHLLGAVRPGVRAVYDHYSRVVRYKAADLWDGVIPGYDARHHDLDETLSLVEKSLGSYVDCHVWLFTPDSLVEQLHELRVIGRSQWYVEEVLPTAPGQIEFMVRMRRLPRGADPRDQVADELLPQGTRPDWLDDPARTTRVAGLEKKVSELGDELDRRKDQVRRLRRTVQRQRADLQDRGRLRGRVAGLLRRR
jgi:Methyltransferase domain